MDRRLTPGSAPLVSLTILANENVCMMFKCSRSITCWGDGARGLVHPVGLRSCPILSPTLSCLYFHFFLGLLKLQWFSFPLRFDELIGACIRELASSKRPVGPVGQNLQELRRLIDQQKAKEPPGDQKPVLPPQDRKPVLPPQDRKPVPPPQDRKPVLPMPDQKPIPPQPDRKPIDVKPRMPAASPGQPPQPEKAKKKRPNSELSWPCPIELLWYCSVKKLAP